MFGAALPAFSTYGDALVTRLRMLFGDEGGDRAAGDATMSLKAKSALHSVNDASIGDNLRSGVNKITLVNC